MRVARRSRQRRRRASRAASRSSPSSRRSSVRSRVPPPTRCPARRAASTRPGVLNVTARARASSRRSRRRRALGARSDATVRRWCASSIGDRVRACSPGTWTTSTSVGRSTMTCMSNFPAFSLEAALRALKREKDHQDAAGRRAAESRAPAAALSQGITDQRMRKLNVDRSRVEDELQAFFRGSLMAELGLRRPEDVLAAYNREVWNGLGAVSGEFDPDFERNGASVRHPIYRFRLRFAVRVPDIQWDYGKYGRLRSVPGSAIYATPRVVGDRDLETSFCIKVGLDPTSILVGAATAAIQVISTTTSFPWPDWGPPPPGCPSYYFSQHISKSTRLVYPTDLEAVRENCETRKYVSHSETEVDKALATDYLQRAAEGGAHLPQNMAQVYDQLVRDLEVGRKRHLYSVPPADDPP